MHPVGPRSAGVYWFRRVLVAVVVLAVAAGIGWWVVSRGSGPKVDPAAAAVGTTTPKLTGVLAAESTTAASAVGDNGDSSTADSPATGADTAGASATAGTSHGSSVPTSAAGHTTTPTAATVVSGKAAVTTGAATSTGGAASTTPTTMVSKAGTKTTAKAGATPAATTTAPKTTAPKTTAPKTPPPPKPSYDASGNLICADSDIAVRATTQASVFPVGSQPRLGMTVTNTGKVPCVRDVSGTLQVYTVYTAAGHRVWSTADCVPGTGHEVRQFAPGQSAGFLIVWSGKTSDPGCTATRVRVKAGEYKLIAQLGTLPSKPVAFTMR